MTIEPRPRWPRECRPDTGEGIAAADLPGSSITTTGRTHGSGRRAGGHGGLGLAIARRIAELHGGRLRIDSTEGQGTRVGFDLPLAEAREEPHV